MSYDDPLLNNPSLNSPDQHIFSEEDFGDVVDVSSPLHSLGAEPAPSFPPLFFVPNIVISILIGLFIITVSLLIWVKPISQRVLNDWLGISVCQMVEIGSLPVISIVFTYFHIFAALWLTFYPINYVGILQIPGTNMGLGWQGIVPFKCVEMAKMAVDMMTKKLINIEEIFRLIKPSDVRDKLSVTLQQSCAPLIDTLGSKYAPTIWNSLPPDVKEDLTYRLSKSTPDVVVKYLEELQKPGVLTKCLDVEHLVTTRLMNDRDLLNQIFIRCGHAELAFIRDCGAYLGGFFGIIQAIIYCYYDDHWVLPVAGFIVGCITNWVALFMIFAPIDPVYIPLPWPSCLAFGPCKRKRKLYNAVCHEHVYRETCGSKLGLAELTFHGLFLSRQTQVSEQYGIVASEHLLNARAVLHELMTGPNKQLLFNQMVKHIQDHVDTMLSDLTSSTFSFQGKLTTLLTPEFLLGESMMTNIRNDIIAYSMSNLPHWLCNDEILILFDRSLDARNVLAEKMNAVPSSEFEGVLHPVFQSDEKKLVILGGLLGAVIGLIQTYLINTGCG